ncbi:MAG TPA: sugar:proton symporter [Actinocrinis sp.]|uniref:sugar:proton symporter n=1 Tax=Actinocrinis sp. TaxID=1920516 RepID=UPI002D70E96D|nr:sugar:proton symporter [Actinocrinis sp.]HZU54611.1 sugar:proton symporter [Actinocrinis sp.]
MGTHTVHRTGVPARSRAGVDFGRLLLTLAGCAAVIVAAFLDWTRSITGTDLSNHALVKTEFFAQGDIVKSVGGISILLGLVALVGLVDRTGWLTRLAGALGIVLFVLLAIEVYRSAQHSMQAGAWLALGGSVVLIIAGFLGQEIVEAPTVVEQVNAPERDPFEARNREW